MFITDKGEIVYSLIKSENLKLRSRKLENRQNNSEPQTPNSQLLTHNSLTKAVALRESLVYSNQKPDDRAQNTDKIKGINKSETKVNYFKGTKENWRADISTWQEVSLGEVYKGVELRLRAYGKNVEKIFTVNPKGSVEDIKLKIEGAKKLTVNKDGELEIETELGIIKYTKPVAYQEIDGKKVEVDVDYRVMGQGLWVKDDSELSTPNSELIYAFKVEKYDKTKPLIIDPLLASTFLGGSLSDDAYSIAIDSSGNVFIAGRTWSSNYPTTLGVYDTTHNGSSDVFVSKLDSSLSSLLSSTFIGGNSWDYAYALAIDFSGNVFVAGLTNSSDYPITSGAYGTTYNGGDYDVFVSKLDSDLSAGITCTDADGDMYAVEGGACGAVDCNDNDPAVNPEATEICDGVDNNCDGSVDVGCNVDLYISSLSAPGSANSGDTVLVSDTTNKSGVSLVGATTTKIYFSTDNKWWTNDTYLGSRAVPAFGAGAQSSSGSTDVTIPTNTCTKTYYLIARADANGNVSEWNEGNNNRVISIAITRPDPSADLYVSNVTAPVSANAGDTITVTDTTNKSGCAAGASTTRVYLSKYVNGYAGIEIGSGRAVPAFTSNPGAQTNSGSTIGTIPSGGCTGSCYIVVKADADGAITEWNEGNNKKATPITITSP